MDHESDIERAGRAKRGSPFLTTDQAAAYLKISAKSLTRLRRAGQGPPFRRHCRFVQHHIDALDSWSRASRAQEPGRVPGDRPSYVEGTRVHVRLDLGGRSILN